MAEADILAVEKQLDTSLRLPALGSALVMDQQRILSAMASAVLDFLTCVSAAAQVS